MGPTPPPPETALYAPVKRLLERQGFVVKAEVGAADVVGRRGDDLLIVELKRSFSLTLLHQAVTRLAMTDLVYVAVLRAAGRGRRKALAANVALCRRLGLGVLLVDPATDRIDIACEPGPYASRTARKRRAALLREFDRRTGDPNTGGAVGARMTAYRQDAIRCLALLHAIGPTKAAVVAKTVGVARARAIMADNHYGWFERVDRGVYGLTERGVAASAEHADMVEALLRDAPIAE